MDYISNFSYVSFTNFDSVNGGSEYELEFARMDEIFMDKDFEYNYSNKVELMNYEQSIEPYYNHLIDNFGKDDSKDLHAPINSIIRLANFLSQYPDYQGREHGLFYLPTRDYFEFGKMGVFKGYAQNLEKAAQRKINKKNRKKCKEADLEFQAARKALETFQATFKEFHFVAEAELKKYRKIG